MRSIPMQKKVARLDHEIGRAKASADEATVRGEPWSSDVRAKLVPLIMNDQALKRQFEEAEAAMFSDESAAAYFQPSCASSSSASGMRSTIRRIGPMLQTRG